MGPSFGMGSAHQPTFSLRNQGSRLRGRRQDFARAQAGGRGRPIPAMLGGRNSRGLVLPEGRLFEGYMSWECPGWSGQGDHEYQALGAFFQVLFLKSLNL